MSSSTVRRIERPGARIAYRRAGQGPPLLIFHATLSSSRQLRTLATLLAARFSVISVDRRGSGDSADPSLPAQPIDVAVHIEDVAAIAAAEGIGPAVIVGHSYGGCIALELAARRPQLVRAVFAYEPPYAPLAPQEAREQMAAVGQRMLVAAERGDLADAALTFLAGVSGAAAVAALSPASRERIGRAGTGAVADATLLGMDPDGLSRIDCPVRLATGADSQPLYADIAGALVARIAGAEQRCIDGADHTAPIIRPEQVAAEIIAFTDR